MDELDAVRDAARELRESTERLRQRLYDRIRDARKRGATLRSVAEASGLSYQRVHQVDLDREALERIEDEEQKRRSGGG